MKRNLFSVKLCTLFVSLVTVFTSLQAQEAPAEYELIQKKLSKGWHTLNHTSVLSHVLMPGSLSVKLSLKSNHPGAYGYMGDVYPSCRLVRAEKAFPIAYSADGSYTDIIVEWDGNKMQVQSANDGIDLVLLATPISSQILPNLIIEPGFLWNASGLLQKKENAIIANLASSTVEIKSTESSDKEYLPLNVPYLSIPFKKQVGIYTGKTKTIEEIKAIIDAKKNEYESSLNAYGKDAEVVKVIQNAIGWNTTYDPINKRVITPVSRYWSECFGGPYVLFNWDTFFGAYMSALFNKELAFSNAIAITKSITPGGFIPNYSSGGEKASMDRSQPPVGSTIVREIYRKYPEKWFLSYLFKDLLSNNRWFDKDRSTPEKWLCWGSNEFGDASANTAQAAGYESGLDNSPMYEQVPFNTKTHQLELADAGLQSLYIMDCQSLADIANILGEKKIAKELLQRAAIYSSALSKLWDKQSHQYLNFRTDKREFSNATSPTTFYPFLTKTVSTAQALDMVKLHLQNPEEFGGDLIIPACAKNTPQFQLQDYWKGRIWAPLNMLVYLGVQQYNLPDYKAELVQKSKKLLLDNYKRTGGYVYENYNGISGEGRNDDERLDKSDNFYSWGALLGFISIVDAGYMGKPLEKIYK